MRREDDTRQPQTETDAADTSEYLSIVLFILSVTSHPKWSAGHGAAEGVALNTHTHACMWRIFMILFGVSFCKCIYVPEGGFASASLQLGGLIKLWMMLLKFFLFFSLSGKGLEGAGVAVCMCINVSPQATYQTSPCYPNLQQPPPWASLQPQLGINV